jgi:hypothetical protein
MECRIGQHTSNDVQSLIVGQLEQEIHFAALYSLKLLVKTLRKRTTSRNFALLVEC